MSKKFTIIELLMIVAIIGVLTSILLPYLSEARAKVKQSVCLSNSKQIFLASTSYIVEHNGYGPSDEREDDSRWTSKLLGTYIERKLGNQPSPTFNCPSGYDQIKADDTNIGMNIYITGKKQELINIRVRPLLKASPSETCMLIDTLRLYFSVRPAAMTNAKVIDEPNGGNNARHQLKANVTFLDGHATAKTASFLLSKTDREDTFWDVEQ
ncbi:MAG: hypothetical protein MK132_02115 [Lentisphaerales bacterium]|nr:hypothetical protein [Lentisphaerales bacterium]